MGIWCNVVIDNQKTSVFVESLVTPYSSSSHISLDKGRGRLGLLSFPKSASTIFYPLHDTEYFNVAVDGYIDNIAALRQRLSLHEDTHTGTVITTLYERYGAEGLYRLEGGFSLILTDSNKKMTLLYRSFLTGYSLYYVRKNNLLSVSTNPVDILHRPDVSNSLSMEQMSAHFSIDPKGWNDTIFSDMNEVEHGEMVFISSKGIESKKRPLNEILIAPTYGSKPEIIEKYRELVKSTVEKKIHPKKKYGIMLSSGIDSSTLALFASKLLREKGSELRAYSWSLPGYGEADESKKIKELSNALEINLTLFDARGYMPFSNLDNLPLHPDMPITNLYAPTILELYRRVSEDGVNILFNGHYGDNLFTSTGNILIDIVKDRQYKLFTPTLISLIEQVGYKNALKKSPEIRSFIKYFLPFYNSKKPFFNTREWLSSEAKVSRRVAWEKRKPQSESVYRQFSYALSKRSVNSGTGRYITGRYNIERLEPFRDLELLNYSLRIPSYMSYRGGEKKYIAREAMRGLLPESIRTHGRVGLLNQFARDGFMKHRTEIRERLFDETEAWKLYVDEEWMDKRFKKNTEFRDVDLLPIWMSLHMAPWQKAIRSGGSLYEKK